LKRRPDLVSSSDCSTRILAPSKSRCWPCRIQSPARLPLLAGSHWLKQSVSARVANSSGFTARGSRRMTTRTPEVDECCKGHRAANLRAPQEIWATIYVAAGVACPQQQSRLPDGALFRDPRYQRTELWLAPLPRQHRRKPEAQRFAKLLLPGRMGQSERFHQSHRRAARGS